MALSRCFEPQLKCELRAQIYHYKLYSYVGWVERSVTQQPNFSISYIYEHLIGI